jgi:GT2 family glycosyltransferase
LATSERVVYVDSASTDGSVDLARSLGAQVLQLDMSTPFSAARARNAGWRLLASQHPRAKYVQFVDGDCCIAEHWVAEAHAALERNPQWVAVCGRRRERFPDASIYNWLCDLEWSTPAGQSNAFGGDAMVRLDALESVGGYRDDVIAGEEPELCVRLRRQGGQIWRLDTEMTAHDANIHQFRQWWTRAKRGGYAFALGAHLHGNSDDRHWVNESRRAQLWGLFLPTLIAGGTLLVDARLLGLTLIYALQFARLFARFRHHGWQRAAALSAFTVIGKFAEAAGHIRFWQDQLLRRNRQIIEYK